MNQLLKFCFKNKEVQNLECVDKQLKFTLCNIGSKYLWRKLSRNGFQVIIVTLLLSHCLILRSCNLQCDEKKLHLFYSADFISKLMKTFKKVIKNHLPLQHAITMSCIIWCHCLHALNDAFDDIMHSFWLHNSLFNNAAVVYFLSSRK